MKNILLSTVFTFLICVTYSQVGIGTTSPNSSSMLDIESTDKGVLIPRLTTVERTGISGLGLSEEGLTVYDSTTDSFWFWDGTQWVEIKNADNFTGWLTTGNSGTTNGTHFIGTTDTQDLDIRTNNVIRTRITQKGQIEILNTGRSVFIGESAGANDDLSNNENIFVGYNTGMSNVGGSQNTAVGYQSLYSNTSGSSNVADGYHALYSNIGGSYNTASGFQSLYSNQSGDENVAVGAGSLYSNLSGTRNVGVGYQALSANTSGSWNTALGSQTLQANTTGVYNTAAGIFSLASNTDGSSNVAYGAFSLYLNTSGEFNTALGQNTLYSNQLGSYNVSVGSYSLGSNTNGNFNTAIGFSSLTSNTNGTNNSAVGNRALYSNTDGVYNTSVGDYSLYSNTNGRFNTAIGYLALYNGTSYTNTTALGNGASPTASNMIHLGNTSVTWIGGQVNWSTYSDKRIKTNIKDDVKGLDFILKLHPVTYHIDKDRQDALLGIEKTPDYPEKYAINKVKQSGFLAQEVEEAAKASGYDFSGISKPKGDTKLYSLSYSQFVVPLVKAVQEQQNIIEKLKEENNNLNKRLKKLEAILLEKK